VRRHIGIHRTERRFDSHIDAVVCNIQDDRLAIAVSDHDHRTLDIVHKLPLVDLHASLIIAGKHVINLEVFSLDQTGNDNGIPKLKQNVVLAEIDLNLSLIVSVENFTDLREGLSRYDHLVIFIMIFKANVTDRDSMTVKRDNLEYIILYFHQLTSHHLVAVVRRDRKNRLTN